MNLQERLQTELIGELDEKNTPYSMQDPETHGANDLRKKQSANLKALAATIAADLKGMLPPKIKTGDHHNYRPKVVAAYNAAIDDMYDAIDRYTGVEGME